MHRFDESAEALARAIFDYALERVRMDPPPLDRSRTPSELAAAAGRTITPAGIGGEEALRVFADALAPATISVDHPRFLAFVPAAPTDAAILFDLVVGASSIYGGSWLEGAGAVFAENEALRWLADLAGFPPGAGGVFVTGGTAANLSALVVARDVWRTARGEHGRSAVAVSDAAHSSVAAAARVMDASNGRRPDRREGPSHGRSARPCARRHRGRGRRLRRRRHRRHHERRLRRRPRRIADVAEAARLVAPRRRRVRPGCARSGERAAPVRRSRAGRLVLGRSAQVALRAVRLRGAACIATPSLRGPRTRSTPRTSTCCTRGPIGTRRTTRSTSPAARAACRSGSRSRRTAPMRTPPRSKRRSRSRATWHG